MLEKLQWFIKKINEWIESHQDDNSDDSGFLH